MRMVRDMKVTMLLSVYWSVLSWSCIEEEMDANMDTNLGSCRILFVYELLFLLDIYVYHSGRARDHKSLDSLSEIWYIKAYQAFTRIHWNLNIDSSASSGKVVVV